MLVVQVSRQCFMLLPFVCHIAINCDCMKLLSITGQVWAHHCCAAWSEGVIQTEDYNLRFVDKAVFAGLTQVWSLHCVMVFLAHLAEIFI